MSKFIKITENFIIAVDKIFTVQKIEREASYREKYGIEIYITRYTSEQPYSFYFEIKQNRDNIFDKFLQLKND